MIASGTFGFAYLDASELPSPPTTIFPSKSAAEVRKVEPLKLEATISASEKRINDGACDPQGRFIAGSLGHKWGTKDGRVYRVVQNATGAFSSEVVFGGVTCGNGLGWTKDGKTMCAGVGFCEARADDQGTLRTAGFPRLQDSTTTW